MSKKECPSCAMEVESTSKTCPICGYEFTGFPSWIRWMAIALLILFALYFIF
jgi:RNA polymerase subunit RPABC4/transcription elongation factor Spt4